jgi:hypothetical protein
LVVQALGLGGGEDEGGTVTAHEADAVPGVHLWGKKKGGEGRGEGEGQKVLMSITVRKRQAIMD